MIYVVQDIVKDVLRQVKYLQVTTKNKSHGLLSGNYYSIFKGQGLEFSEIREYRPGDDVRTIDWKVTARFDSPYVKEFIEERNTHVYVMLDMSGSNNFGNNISKKRRALEVTASLLFSAFQNNDLMGAFLFTDKIEKFVPAGGGKKHMLKILNDIATFEGESRATNIESCLKKVSKILKRSSMIIIISDFFDSSDFYKPLRVLGKTNDIVAIMITDEHEQKLPDVGLIELEDEETGEQLLVDTSNNEFQREYQNVVLKHQNELVKNLKKNRVSFAKVLSNEPYDIPLKKLFKYRAV